MEPSWLVAAFGFEEDLLVPGEGDAIAHAELRFGKSLLMLGSARDDAFLMKTPNELDGAFTQTLNVYVPDPDAHCAHAKKVGAHIVSPPADTTFGSRGYVALDLEGFVWNFDTYRPE